MTASRPRGGKAVSEALVQAARALLAERSPRAISGQEVAERAGVNYGQIHHHFGTKDQLFAEALRRKADEFLAEEMDGGTREPVPIVVDRTDGLWRALAHLALDRTNERSPEDTVMQRFLQLRAEALVACPRGGIPVPAKVSRGRHRGLPRCRPRPGDSQRAGGSRQLALPSSGTISRTADPKA